MKDSKINIPDNKEKLINDMKSVHLRFFGTEPQVISYAPGRAEVLGNHTDYNSGTVLSTAINRGHCFAVSSRLSSSEESDKSDKKRGKIRLLAGDTEEIVSFELADESSWKDFTWANYVRGVFFFLSQKGLPIGDWDCTFLGNIPIGSGLSSSAALEVAAAYAAQEMGGLWFDKIETAKLCREAEFRFAGCNCGLLDQFSSIFGEEHALIHSDFRTLTVKPISVPEEICFLLITPEISHSLSDSPYNERRESCELAVRELNNILPGSRASLREITPEEFKTAKEKIDPTAAKRAEHIVGEIERVEKGVLLLEDKKLLKNKKIKEFGELMYLSHSSSRLNFENSSPELDKIVEVAQEAGASGARLSGGGWGGSLIVITQNEEAEDLSQKIIAGALEKGLKTTVNTIIPSGGAAIIKQKK